MNLTLYTTVPGTDTGIRRARLATGVGPGVEQKEFARVFSEFYTLDEKVVKGNFAESFDAYTEPNN